MGAMSSDFQLNTIATKRASLSFEEAVHVWKVRLSGEKQHVIAAMFGTNPGRIAEILTREVHPGAKDKALDEMK